MCEFLKLFRNPSKQPEELQAITVEPFAQALDDFVQRRNELLDRAVELWRNAYGITGHVSYELVPERFRLEILIEHPEQSYKKTYKHTDALRDSVRQLMGDDRYYLLIEKSRANNVIM